MGRVFFFTKLHQYIMSDQEVTNPVTEETTTNEPETPVASEETSAPEPTPEESPAPADEPETPVASEETPAPAPEPTPVKESVPASVVVDDDEDEDYDDEEEDEEDSSAKKRHSAADSLKEHLNIIFIGHVDAGKSTIAGNILYLTGMVDERTIAKYEREAKEKKHGSWFLAFIMDTNEEERAKGKTVEVGRAHFSSEKKRYTILDAPGHKNYVPNMIGGAAQADVGILVISARIGEFEAGFEGQGQTREHTTLAKTLGVKQLIIVVNKMDEQSVGWSFKRFSEIQKKFSQFLKGVGYNAKTDIRWVPISGFTGANIKEPLAPGVADWYKGTTLLQTLDDLEPINRSPDGPVRLPVLDRYKERGSTVVLGKLESGTLKKGDMITMMPNRQTTEVLSLELDVGEVDQCLPGEIVSVSLKEITTVDISQGFVLCSEGNVIPVVKEFECQLAVIDLLPNKPIMSAGYEAVIHVHTCTEEVLVEELISVMDKKTKKPSKRKPTFVRKGDIVNCRISCAKAICCELFDTLQQLGRFTLRDEGKTIAIGKIIKHLESSE